MKLPLLVLPLGAAAGLALASDSLGWYRTGPARGPAFAAAPAAGDSADPAARLATTSPAASPEAVRAALDDAVAGAEARVRGRINCSVLQEGTPTNELWWFGGADAGAYSEVVTLVAVPGRAPLVPPIRWEVVQGRDRVAFPNGIDEIVTPGTTVQVHATGASDAAPFVRRDVTIRLRDASGDGCEYRMVVYAPHHLVPTSEIHLPGTVGYVSEITYRSEDQFNRILPFPTELSNDVGPDTSDFPGETWPWRPEKGVLVAPASWVDLIDRDAEGLFTNPPVQSPGFPLGSTAVDHRVGHFRHGSTTTVAGPDNNPGKIVRSLWWQTYQDHARHE